MNHSERIEFFSARWALCALMALFLLLLAALCLIPSAASQPVAGATVTWGVGFGVLLLLGSPVLKWMMKGVK